MIENREEVIHKEKAFKVLGIDGYSEKYVQEYGYYSEEEVEEE